MVTKGGGDATPTVKGGTDDHFCSRGVDATQRKTRARGPKKSKKCSPSHAPSRSKVASAPSGFAGEPRQPEKRLRTPHRSQSSSSRSVSWDLRGNQAVEARFP